MLNLRSRYNVNRIKNFIGEDPDMMLDLIKLFLKNTPSDIQNLQQSQKQKDYEKVWYYAHKLKNSVDNFSIEEIQEEIRIIEERAKRRTSLEDIPALINHVVKVLQEIMTVVKKDYQVD